MNSRIILTGLLLILTGKCPAPQAQEKQPAVLAPAGKVSSVCQIDAGASYYTLTTREGVVAHVITAETKSGKWELKPLYNTSLKTTAYAAERAGASAAVNGGYFDLQTGLSVSHVVIDGQQQGLRLHLHGAYAQPDPLAKYRAAISNRSEIRVLINAQAAQIIDIAPHKSAVPPGYKLLHSLQAGPQLLPTLTTRQEAFIRFDRYGNKVDAISAESRASRTAFGITGDGHMYLVVVEGPEQGSSSPGLTLSGLAALMKSLGCKQALNLDGGHSSSMFVRPATGSAKQSSAGRTVASAHPQRRVKTVLALVHAEK